MLFACVQASGCRMQAEHESAPGLTPGQLAMLTDTISGIANGYPGKIGVALIINNTDTIAINNRCDYPMMSVFKLHQAIALCESFDRSGGSLDSIISVERDSLDPATWSPMLKEHTEPSFTLSVRELMRYALIQSDNNASNLMFERLVDVGATDSLIATLIPRRDFQIACTEKEMKADHSRAYNNRTSPLGAAMLINRLFTDSILRPESREFICRSLSECLTGTDRIIAPLIDKKGVKVAHKTGSGYIDNGILAAQNDVAYITLPNGGNYSLAVFVKDFHGTEAEASAAIARISAAIYATLKNRAQYL